MRSPGPAGRADGWRLRLLAFVVCTLVAWGTPFGAVGALSSDTETTGTGAWSEGPCPSADGVTVVVDFHDLGGGVHVRCAPGSVSDGFDALSRAGISYTTALSSPGFLCRIAGKPADDPCVGVSPPTAYWSYWVASRGGSWCYSNLGAASRTPPPGTVEGWSFARTSGGDGAPAPGIAPPAAPVGTSPTPLGSADCDSSPSAPTATTTTAPATTTLAPAASPTTTTVAGNTPTTTRPRSDEDRVHAGSGDAPSAPEASADTTDEDDAVDGDAADEAADADERAASVPSTASTASTGDDERAVVEIIDLGGEAGGGGFPTGMMVGTGLVGLLGLGAFATNRRRLRLGNDDDR